LEAAVHGAHAGFDVQVFERGSVAENVTCWGHVRLFSPFGINVSSWGRRTLAGNSSAATRLPQADEILTGREFIERYLLPLSRLPQLAGRIHERTPVVAIGRSRTWKRDLIGKPERGHDPFQLLVRGPDGERNVEADVVLDCSGTYATPNWLGAGGMPCVGERAAAAAIDYHLPDLLGTQREKYADRKTLVVGSGYSAATAVVGLAMLAETQRQTRVLWLTRTGRTPPMPRVDHDPLAERDKLAEAANRLAFSHNGLVEWRAETMVRRVDRRTDGTFSVALEQNGARSDRTQLEGVDNTVIVDRIVAAVGYKPDRSLYEELQIHECYASQGPMRLAAALLGESSADCLAQQGQGAATLVNPEPGFYILGSKSYGRDSRFLLKVGLEQIQDVLTLMAAPNRAAVEKGDR
jgi:hypothetical protein